MNLIDTVFHLSSNFFAYERECINTWWMHLQVFKVRTWQVWASPRKQIKQNYHGASTRVEFPELGHCCSISCLFSHGKKQAAVFFTNHCWVVRSKELCRKVFSVLRKTNCLATIMGWVSTCGRLPHGKKENKREHSCPLEGVRRKDFKTWNRYK